MKKVYKKNDILSIDFNLSNHNEHKKCIPLQVQFCKQKYHTFHNDNNNKCKRYLQMLYIKYQHFKG